MRLSKIVTASSLGSMIGSNTGVSALAASSSSLSSSLAAASPPSYSIRQSISELAPLYDAFILDQYGVLHNGETSLEGAVECVEELYKMGKKLIILSNTSGPAASAMAKLPKYGFDLNHFIGAVTSGEECSRYIRETYGSDATTTTTTTKKKVLWFTWDGIRSNVPRPTDFLEQCGNVHIADSVDEADFVLAHGSHVWQRPDSQVPLENFLETGSLETIDPILEQCLERNLPMVCANPDFVVRMPDDSMAYMPGNIAKRYSDMGGHCQTFGKPHPDHFVACLEQLNVNRRDAPLQTVHVGDSLHHDIAGANAANVDSIFITSGIHCNELETQFGVLPDESRLEALIYNEKHVPTHVMSAFRF